MCMDIRLGSVPMNLERAESVQLYFIFVNTLCCINEDRQVTQALNLTSVVLLFPFLSPSVSIVQGYLFDRNME
jgi:hypothetical protein